MTMRRGAVWMVVVLVAVAVVLAPVVGAAEAIEQENGDPATELGLGVASFLATVPYGAAKVVVATLGGVVGGFTYLLSGFDQRAADAVWYTTIPGDYVITPDHLKGKKDLRFTGVPPESPPAGER